MTPEKRAFARAARKLERQAARLVQDELGAMLTPQRRARIVQRLAAGEPMAVIVKLAPSAEVMILYGSDLVGGLVSAELLADWTGAPETLQ